MKYIHQLAYIFFSFFLIGCGSSSLTKENYLFKKQPGKIYFTILQLNDVYEIAPVQGGKYGGMARVETVRQALLKENPNTYTVLAGDFLNPSLLGTMKVDGERVKGKQMVEVMNAMNFDLVAFGNHEFDISYKQLQNRLNESDFEWLSSNVLHNQNGKSHYFHKIKNGKKVTVNDSYIQEVHIDGMSIKIGFISACIPSNPKDYVTYGDIYEESERSYNEIKGKVDVILGLTHLAIEQDIELAKKFQDIPLIMGGHEHTHNYLNVGKVTIAKADANAKSVYIHRFEYDPITKQTIVKSELREINHKIKEDERVGAVVEKWQGVLKTKIKDVVSNPDEIIFKAKTPLEGRDTPTRSQQTNLGGIITKAMSFAYDNNVDCALLNGGSIRIDDVLQGKISVVDIFRVLPYGGPVLKVDLKGSLLLKVLKYGENAIGTGAYLQYDNIKQTEASFYVQNKLIEPTGTYTVAISDYLLRGFDIPFLKEDNKDVLKVYKPVQKDLAFDIRNAIIQYFKKGIK